MNLTAERVDQILSDCLFNDTEVATSIITGHGEVPEGCLKVEGIMHTFGFQPERLAAHKEDVRELLEELDATFKQSIGGGWSFLNLCQRTDGVIWGEHLNCEVLCCLAIGVGLGQWLLDREAWKHFPGGVPYFIYLDKDGS